MTALHGSYDFWLVALSALVAILSAGAVVDLAGRVVVARGRTRLVWLIGGAIAMGSGIWSMHYIGMLAFHLPIHVRYHIPTVVLSLIAAVAASGVALFVSSRERLGLARVAVGSAIMGGGIATMHYVGMAAMRLPAAISWRPPLVFASVLVAIAVSATALALVFRFSHGATPAWTWGKAGGALVMGAAIPLMHYTGMAAAGFQALNVPVNTTHTTTVSSLGIVAIGIGTLLVLGAAIGSSFVDRRLDAITRASEARYRLLFDANPVPTWVFEQETLRFLTVNDAAIRQYGYSREEFLGMTILDIRPEEDAPAVAREVRDRPPGWFFTRDVRRHRRKSGAVFKAETSGQSLEFEGRPARIIMAADVSEREHAAEAQAALVRDLQAALLEVKTLRGILPICANCKRIRSDQGSWEQIESYMRARTDAEFSHGICPDCAAKVYAAEE